MTNRLFRYAQLWSREKLIKLVFHQKFHQSQVKISYIRFLWKPLEPCLTMRSITSIHRCWKWLLKLLVKNMLLAMKIFQGLYLQELKLSLYLNQHRVPETAIIGNLPMRRLKPFFIADT
ncbi:hypothetical protein CT154_13905 [Komagataeibacter xylinus]|nr:hypothetical protein CT154_13905 [Komagataeibacter xylinus]